MTSRLLNFATHQGKPFLVWNLTVLTLTITIKQNLYDVHPINGSSMSLALNPHFNTTGQKDYVLINKFSHRPYMTAFRRPSKPNTASDDEDRGRIVQGLKRGDVVTFWAPHNPESLSVKRITGLEGDIVFRDVRRVGSERHLLDTKGSTDAQIFGLKTQDPVVKVPKGAIWVEGDYWRQSLDSNDLGAVPVPLVVGRAVAIVWPPRRWGWISGERGSGQDVSGSFVKGGAVLVPPEWEG